MGKIILVTGGVRSGKSQFAENMLKNHKDVAYIATAVANDDAMRARIQFNKANRPASWTTYEVTSEMADIFETTSHDAYIVDSIPEYLLNYMFFDDRFQDASISFDDAKKAEKDIVSSIKTVIEKAKQCSADVVFVTSEIGLGMVPKKAVDRVIRDIVGKVNQELGIVCDAAWFVSCGIPQRMK